MSKVKVVVNGACGRMGQEVVKAVLDDSQLELVGAVDVKRSGTDIGLFVGRQVLGIEIGTDLVKVIRASQAEVLAWCNQLPGTCPELAEKWIWICSAVFRGQQLG